MILRKGRLPAEPRSPGHEALMGRLDQVMLSDAGGLTKFGLYAETLHPGARSSDRHWHEDEDEFLYMLDGEATLIDDHGPQPLHAGDAVAWKAGTPDAHHIVNQSSASCTYLIMGTRVPRDTIHYPDLGQTLFNEPDHWHIVDRDGKTVKEGRD